MDNGLLEIAGSNCCYLIKKKLFADVIKLVVCFKKISIDF